MFTGSLQLNDIEITAANVKKLFAKINIQLFLLWHIHV